MSSAGQAIGYALGAVVGYFTGGLSYVALGTAVGGAIGGALDPPKGPKIVGPRLDDLSVQTSTYGAPLGRAYGTVAVTGNIFWLEGDALKEHTKTEKQGGKGGGGGGSESTTYSYSATFAVGLLHIADPAQTVTLRRLWIDTTLVFDGSATNTDSTIASIKGVDYSVGGIVDATYVATASAGYDISGDSEGVSFTFFSGDDDQIPHPRMQADKGAANVSGYPGLCYIVIEDLDLSKYSNTLMRAQVKAELSIAPATVADLQKIADLPWPIGGDYTGPGTIFTRSWGCEYSLLGTAYTDLRPRTIETYRYTLGEGINTVSARWIASEGWDEGFCIFVKQSDVQCAVFVENRGSIVVTGNRVNIIYPGYTYRGPDLPLGDYSVGDYYAVLESGMLYVMSFGAVDSVGLFTVQNGEVYASSGIPDRVDAMGYSANYIFCARDLTGPNRTVLTRYVKSSLTIHDQTTFSGLFFCDMQVIDDDHAYFSDYTGNLYFWSYGSAPALIGAIIQPITSAFGSSSFCVVNNTYAVSTRIDFRGSSGASNSAIYLGAMMVPQQSATLHQIITAECESGGIDASDLDLTALTNSGVRGYRIAAPSSIRSALEPLQAAFPFDVAQSGYKLRFVSRGGSSVAVIPEEDLGAGEGKDKSGALLPIAREMDSQIHSRVSVRYIDPEREYDTGEQYADRPETASVSEWVNDLPIVMTNAEAAQVADILLSKEWVERREFGPFSLPPTWLALEPADVITVAHRGQAYTLRLTRIEYAPDGRLTCSAKQTAAASYVSTATGSDPLTVGQSVVALKGSTAAYLLDIPRIRSEQDDYGLAFGLLGKASGWPGGLLLRSDDSGNNWVSCGALNARAAVFTASGPLSSHHGYSPDFASLLTVTPEAPGAALYSVTEEQFYSGSNLAAYGVDGRWEILAFRTATSSSGTFILKDFLRGLYGTEANGALHSAGDLFIILDTTTIAFAQLPTNALGVPRLYRPVTQGGSSGSANDITDTYDGVNFKPLAPVDLHGERLVGVMDWHLGWTRRTRWPVELFSGAVVPLEEPIESYDLEIYSSGTFATLKRAFNGLLSPTATYTEAQQFSDFGLRQDTLHLKIYQLSSVVGRGTALTQSIYIKQVAPADGYDDAILLLSPSLYLKMDNTTTTFTDSSTTASNGTGAASNITYGQPGLLSGNYGHCVYLTGGTTGAGYISVPHRAGFNGAFTVTYLFNLASLTGSCYMFHHGDFGVGGSQGFVVALNASRCVELSFFNGGWQATTGVVPVCDVGVTSRLTFTYNNATTFKIFKEGVLIETLTLAAAFVDNTQDLIIGGDKTSGTVTGRITGSIDEFAWFDSVLSDADIYNLFYTS